MDNTEKKTEAPGLKGKARREASYAALVEADMRQPKRVSYGGNRQQRRAVAKIDSLAVQSPDKDKRHIGKRKGNGKRWTAAEISFKLAGAQY